MSMAAGSCIDAQTALGGYRSHSAGWRIQRNSFAANEYTKLWRFEKTWAIFSIFAYLISPWVVALATVSQCFRVYSDVGARVCLIVAVFGLGWGVAVVLNGAGVALVGLSLASAILMGSSVAIGSLGALLLRDAALINTSAAKQILVADSVMPVGVLLCALAGHWRGRNRHRSDNQRRRVTSLGILVCLMAGLLSTLLNIALSLAMLLRRLPWHMEQAN
jgi:L-rhamnose-H+ transport protein